MRVFGLLNRVFPECRLKYALKPRVEHFLVRVTGPPRAKTLKDTITVRYYPTLLLPEYIEDFQLIGYEKYYAIRPGDVIIDGGGYLGLFTLFAAKKVGPTGRVITYEPDQANARLLARNVRLNRLDNVTLVQKGLWSSNTELHFDARGNAGNIDFGDERQNLLTHKISVVALDDEVDRLKLRRVDLVKMNIEGAEIEAVEGCARLMQRHPVNFCIAATHFRNGELTAARVAEVLERRGYEAVIDYPQHLSVYAWPRKAAGDMLKAL